MFSQEGAVKAKNSKLKYKVIVQSITGLFLLLFYIRSNLFLSDPQKLQTRLRLD